MERRAWSRAASGTMALALGFGFVLGGAGPPPGTPDLAGTWAVQVEGDATHRRATFAAEGATL